MKKKIVTFVFFLIIISILGVIYLLNNNVNSINYDKKVINTNDIKTNKFYDKNNNKLDYRLIFSYLCYNDNFDDVPVTDNYKAKFIKNLSELYNFEQYNEDLYNYEADDPNQIFSWVILYDNNTFFIQLFIYKSAYDDQPKLNRELFFKYKVDENGFVDDIELIKEDVYREDDGTPIIRPNYRKFDDYSLTIFEYLVLGLDIIKFNIELRRDSMGYRNIEDIEWEMKEYALTNNLKSRYDINKGLLSAELKENAHEKCEIIVCNILSENFANQKKAIIPIELYCKGKSYYYNLSYSITDDYFLDELKLDEIQ